VLASETAESYEMFVSSLRAAALLQGWSSVDIKGDDEEEGGGDAIVCW